MPEVGLPMGAWSGSDATRELQEVIKQFNATAEKQTRKLIRLTQIIAVLTGVMVLEVALQLWKAF